MAGWNYALGIDENHRAAARALISALGLWGLWTSGFLSDGSCAHTCVRQTGGNFLHWHVEEENDDDTA
jgi:hypothetical protein